MQLIVLSLFIACAASIAFAQPAARPVDPAWLNVRDFGARGDAITDDTASFQRALDDAGKTGNRVFVPSGRYLIKGRLNVPESVTLAGTFDAPARTQYNSGTLE